jgi:G3E family GTPase
MESTGRGDMIQISQATCDILSLSGKKHWIVPRDDAVQVKGKGTLKTYWLNPSLQKRGSESGGSEQGHSDNNSSVSATSTSQVSDRDIIKRHRLVDWITLLLLEHIKKIVRSKKISPVESYFTRIDRYS